MVRLQKVYGQNAVGNAVGLNLIFDQAQFTSE